MRLNGIYEIERLIANGAVSEVFKGFNILSGVTVVIKIIRTEISDDASALEQLRHDATALHALQHEAVAKYIAFSVDPEMGRAYLAMEYLEGPSLADHLARGPIAWAEVDALRSRIGSALDAAHQLGVVHGDLSAKSIILPGGDLHKAKLVDFGFAAAKQRDEAEEVSRSYAAPEQLGLAGGELTAKSDIYSFGLVLAEALRGRPIDMGGSRAERIAKRRRLPDLFFAPASIRPLLQWMLQPDPADRPESMAAMLAWNAPATRFPPPPHKAARPAGGAQRRTSTRRVGAMLGVLIAFGLASASYLYRGDLGKWVSPGVLPTPEPTPSGLDLPTLPSTPAPDATVAPEPSSSPTPPAAAPEPTATPSAIPVPPSAPTGVPEPPAPPAETSAPAAPTVAPSSSAVAPAPEPSSSPAETPASTPEPSPAPTAAPSPSATVSPEPEPSPSTTETPTAPEPTPSPTAVSAPLPSSSPSETAAPEPTESPTPAPDTPTAAPTPSPGATAAPEPEPSASPTDQPVPPAPEPDPTPKPVQPPLPSLSPSPEPEPEPSPTETPVATPEPSPTPTADPTAPPSPAVASPSPTDTPTATPEPSPDPMVPPSPSPVETPTPATEPASPPTPTPTPAAPSSVGAPSPSPAPIESSRPLAARAQAFLSAYDGGDCFVARPAIAGENPADIRALGSDLSAFARFAVAFKDEVGIEPEITTSVITLAECPALQLVKMSAGRSPPRIRLVSEVAGGSRPLAGTVDQIQGRSLTLFGIDNDGTAHRLRFKLTPAGDKAFFSVALAGDSASMGAPQLLLAIASETPLGAIETFKSGTASDLVSRLSPGWTAGGAAVGIELFRVTE